MAQHLIAAKTNPVCPKGHPDNIIKYGVRKGKQIYFCKTHMVRFTDNNAASGRRVPPEQVGAAISMFYEGLSLEQIRRSFGQMYDFQPSTASIYEWVTDYTKLALHEMKESKPQTGRTWVADEMVLSIGGQKYWNWNVMDAETRYLLATRLSPTRGTQDAAMVMRQAAEAAGRPPRFIVTDRLASYEDAIERVFGADSLHVKSGGIRAEVNNNLSERLQGTIRARSKVMRGLKRRETAQLVMDGWALHYNHFRPHESLQNRTPGSVAGIQAPFTDWEAVARLDVRPYSHFRARLERERYRLRDRTFARRGGL